jgi:diguanylate cyclase (GGDEF)-like protein
VQKTYAALLIDIDGLKMINDMRGHATGDAIIAIIADAIRDSICEGDECARIGGDEFFVFAADCTTNEAMAIGRRILDNLAKPTLPLSRAHASVSIGVVVFGGAEAEFNRMYYRDADHALYQARYEGKARIGLFVPDAGDTMEGPAQAFTA